MNLDFTGADRAFQEEVRAFLRDNLPEKTRLQSERAWSYVPKEMTREWHRALYRRGWIAPHWPMEHGGTGWTATQKHIWEEEYQKAHAPRLSSFGLTMVGPVLYTFGTPEQKQQHLPKILSGDVYWCQGYSEPGSGSDLASLKTRAVRDGDHYVVNGHKIWTSHAHHADWIFCLVRTDPTAKQQEGISFLLIDIRTPGIDVRPIISMDGGHYLNEVFFADVRVPAANRIGEENKGWTYAKFLLGHERTGIAGVGKSKEKVRRLKEMARLQADGGGGCLWQDPSFRDKVSLVETRLQALEITNLRSLDSESGGRRAGSEASTLKLNGTEIEQALNELMVEVLAWYAVPWEPEQLRLDSNIEPVAPGWGLGVVSEHLLRRAASIYGGSNEIQRNIIAKMVLAL